MNNLNKLFVTICFSVLVSTAILAVDTSQDVWASNETSYQIKSNAGITFIEGDTSITDNSNGKNNSQSNNIKSDTKKSIFPSTGERQTVFFSLIGIIMCYVSVLFLKKEKKLK